MEEINCEELKLSLPQYKEIEENPLPCDDAKNTQQCDEPKPTSSPPQYKKIEENLLLCKDAESNECKSLQCDCIPTTKEKKRGKACADECLNRLLLMECGDECRSGKYCTNKRFQKREYADLEMFFTGPKGWGIRAKKDINQGDFIIEYVGEIINSKEMSKRIKRYGRDPNHKHHYLMALRSGTVIDATTHGNESRFINHSCDPNAATQKWTVGRQLRIGFFALKMIKVGEEVTFNYQFERYGRHAQKCFCGSANCTGYIGANKEDSGMGSDAEAVSDSVNSLSSSSSDVDDEDNMKQAMMNNSGGAKQLASFFSPGGRWELERQKIKKRGRPRKVLAEVGENHSKLRHLKRHGTIQHSKIRPELISDPTLREQAEVNEILLKGTLRNREQVLEFNRLMVRVDQMESRRRMVDFLLRIDDPNILRLFVANQGFALIRIWFVLPPFERRALQLQSQIARLLMRLPVTNKNQVDEVCIMSTLKEMLSFKLPDKIVIKDVMNQLLDAVEYELDGSKSSNTQKSSSQAIVREFDMLKELAAQLAEKWANLVDWEFRIPKKLITNNLNGEEDGRNSRHSSLEREPHYKRDSSARGRHSFANAGFDSRDSYDDREMNDNNGFSRWRYRNFQKHYRKFLPQHVRRKFYHRELQRRFPAAFARQRSHEENNFGNANSENVEEKINEEPKNDTNNNAGKNNGEQDKDSDSKSYFDPHEPPPTFFNAPTKQTDPTAQQSTNPIPVPMVLSQPGVGQFYPPPFFPPYFFPNGPFIPPPIFFAQNGVAIPGPTGGSAYLPPPPPPLDEPKQISKNSQNSASSSFDDDEQDHSETGNTSKTVKGEVIDENADTSSTHIKIENSQQRDKNKSSRSSKHEKKNMEKKACDKSKTKNEDEKQNDKTRKSTKAMQAEMLQRRLQSLRASLGTKVAPSQWTVSNQSDQSNEHNNNNTQSSQNRSISHDKKKDRKADDEQRDNERKRPVSRDGEQTKNQSIERNQCRSSNHIREDTRRRSGSNRFNGNRGRFGRRNSNFYISPERNSGNSKVENNERYGTTRTNGKMYNNRNENRLFSSRFKRGGSTSTQRIRAQLVQKAIEKQNQSESKLSPEEQKQRQHVHEAKNVEITFITERLKTLVEPTGGNKDTKSNCSERSELDAMVLAVNTNDKKPERQRHSSESSTTSSSSESSSSTTTSSSSTSDNAATTTPRAHHEKPEKRKQNTQSNLQEHKQSSVPTIKGRFLPLKLTTKTLPLQNFTTDRKVENSKIEEKITEQCVANQVSDDDVDDVDEQVKDEMMQPPHISSFILEDGARMDAYIHQLKEYVYYMETLRRDIHGAPPPPISAGAYFARQKQLINSNQRPPSASKVETTNPQQQQQSNASIIHEKKSGSLKRDFSEIQNNQDDNINVNPCAINDIDNNTAITNCTKRPRIETDAKPHHERNQVKQRQATLCSTHTTASVMHLNTPPEDPKITNNRESIRNMCKKEILDEEQQTTIASVSEKIDQNLTENIRLDTVAETEYNLRHSLTSTQADPSIATTATTTTVITPETVCANSSVSTSQSIVANRQSSTESAPIQLMSKSGLWLVAKDSDGTLYYYHKDTRETRWDLPQGEELIMQPAPQQAAQPLVQDPRIIAHQNQQQQQQQHTTTIVCDTLQRRTEFKRQVSALVAKCIEAYRKRFFPNTNDYTNFLRKITHKVLDNQDNNKELLFNDVVQRNTRRLVEEYIRHLKSRESAMMTSTTHSACAQQVP